MSSVAKDNGVLTAIPEQVSSGGESSRPQPIALEVPVSVNGVRTVAGSEKREPFSESTKTVLIFGNGAVVRLSSSVAPGQLLFLTNDKTRKEVVCQVVKSKNYQNVSGYVELEFTEAVTNFWGMRFPAPGTSATPQSSVTALAASAAASAYTPNSATGSSYRNPESELKTKISSEPRVTQQSSANTAQTENGSSGVSPATGTVGARPDKTSNVVEFSKPKPLAPLVPEAALIQSKSLLDAEEVKIPSWLEPLARNAAVPSAAQAEQETASTLEEHADFEDAVEVEDPIPDVVEKSAKTQTTGKVEKPQEATVARELPASSYGTHFLAEEKVTPASATSSGGSEKKLLIIGIAASILVVAGGGAWYLQQQRVGNAAIATVAPSSSAPVSSASSATNGSQPESVPGNSAAAQPSTSGTNTSSPANSESAPAVAATESANTPSPKSANFVDAAKSPASASYNSKRLATVDTAEPEAPAPKKSSLGTVTLSAPVLTKRTVHSYSPEEGVNLEAAPNTSAENLGSGLVAISSQPAAPAPPPVERPIGGKVKEPTLISSMPPLYPSAAKVQKVDGDVKIDALIGINGRVTSTKVISGPTLLRDPAVDAVKHWKYQPATLNGQAVPMHMTVTVQFKLQETP
jgi:TonB family protein